METKRNRQLYKLKTPYFSRGALPPGPIKIIIGGTIMTFTTLNYIKNMLDTEIDKRRKIIADAKQGLEEIYDDTGYTCWTPDEELGPLGAYYRKALMEDKEKLHQAEAALEEFLAHDWN